MTKNKKIILFLLVFLCLCGCGKEEQINYEENKEPIKSMVTLNDFQIELKDKKVENGTSTFTFSVTNLSNESKYLKEILAKAKDDLGNSIVSLLGVINQEIKSGEKIEVNCSYGGDLSNVQLFEYNIEG